MKKGLMLSLAASAVLFAGGDIAPVEPVAEAPAAACDDFYGSATVGVVATMTGEGNVTADDDNTTTVQFGAAAILGVSKEIFSGLTFTAEVQGASLETYSKVGDGNGTRAPGFVEYGALNQFNVAYTWCNTAIKVGRFTIDGTAKELSPLINTGTTYFGLKKTAYEGAMAVNTDIPDTTVWAAYVYNTVTLNAKTTTKKNPRARAGIIAGGFQNTSFADTKITVAGYYDLNGTGDQKVYNWTYMVAGSIDHKWCDTDISLGGAYVKYDSNTTGAGNGSDFVVGAFVKQAFSAATLTLGATYGNMGYSKYTDLTNQKTGDTNNSWAAGASLSTDWCGYKLGASANYRQDKTYQVGASVGKKISGIDFSADYLYTHNGVTGRNDQRIRAKAVYKF